MRIINIINNIITEVFHGGLIAGLHGIIVEGLVYKPVIEHKRKFRDTDSGIEWVLDEIAFVLVNVGTWVTN